MSVMGIIIQKSPDNLSAAIDDGSGSISLRVFEDRGIIAKTEVGGAVQVIGKPREYSGERYILPEIIKNVDSFWLRVWEKEISKNGNGIASIKQTVGANPSASLEEAKDAHPVAEEVESVEESPAQMICDYIRNKDGGNGVDVQEIIEAKVAENCEALVSSLLKNGDIFEIRPGRVKVLE